MRISINGPKLPGDRDLVADPSNEALNREPNPRRPGGEVPPPQQPAPSQTDDSLLCYAGFWPRLGVLLLDDGIYKIVIWPVRASVLWGDAGSHLFLAISGTLFWLLYNVYLVRRFGGTLGKLANCLRIRKPDGEPVGYREALLRYWQGPLFVLLAIFAWFRPLVALAHPLFESILVLTAFWVLAEVIVLPGDPKRRALHD